MIDTNAFTKLVPGFDFLQGLMQGAGQAVPAMGQWIAPTLNPDELEKRISELKTLQFWLEQNGRMIGATIQAMEVQRMTLSTLRSMNLPMAELRDALTVAPQAAAAAPVAPPASATAAPPQEPTGDSAPAGSKPAVDPMQWWGALTQQFAELATKAMHDTGALAARNLSAAAPARSTAAGAPVARKAPAPARKAAARKPPPRRG